MFTLIKNGTLYSPEYLGVRDILIVDKKIIKISERINVANFLEHFEDVHVIDATGKIVVPGFIDQHVHLIGGGGETGFHSRTPEISLSTIIQAGLTTVVGLLGTDGVTRHIESLYAKAKGLEREGITTFIHTGSYMIPSVTITGSVKKDIMFIDKVIGVKVALSDHRSSHCTKEEMVRLASDARVAGMLSAKPGMVHVHMGSASETLDMLIDIVETTEIPVKQFVPTHVTRSKRLFERAKEFAKLGGRIDITAFSESVPKTDFRPSKAIIECVEQGIPLRNITVSSDGNGSIPKYDQNGEIIGMGMGRVDTLHLVFRNLVQNEGMDISEAVRFITSNVADVLQVGHLKGYLREGADADMVIMDGQLNIDTVLAMGKKMMEGAKLLIKGTYE